MNIENVNLCQCNNCENIFIDQNPQIGAKQYKTKLSKFNDLQYLKDSTGEYFWGCGVCETDAYLTDNINENKFATINN